MKRVFAAFCLVALGGGHISVLDAEVLVRISKKEFANQVTEAANDVWIGAQSGAYRVVDDAAIPVPNNEGEVTAIFQAGGQVWIGSTEGLFRWDGSRAVPSYRAKIDGRAIRAIQSIGTTVWLSTTRGLFSLEVDVLSDPYLETSTIETVASIDSALWVGTKRDLCRIDSSGENCGLLANTGLVDGTGVTKIVRAGSEVWFVTFSPEHRYGPGIRLVSGHPKVIFPDREVISVTGDAKGRAWFATTEGVFRLEQGKTDRVGSLTIRVNTIAFLDGQAWAGTTQGAFRWTGKDFEPVGETNPLNVSGIDRVLGQIWLRGDSGAYRFDEDVDLLVRLTTRSLFGQKIHFGQKVKIEEARYDRGGLKPYTDAIRAEFEAILESDHLKFAEEVKEGRFHPVENLERTFSPGLHDLHLLARDTSGNSSEPQLHESVWILPDFSWQMALSALPLLGVIFWGLVLMAAPYRKWCMKLIMKPAVRWFFSLWIVPIALCFASVRRHLLKRYTKEVIKHFPASGCAGATHLSTMASSVEEKLPHSLRLQFGDKSGAPRDLLKCLTWRIATRQNKTQPLQKAFPIHVRCAPRLEQDKGIDEGARQRLANFGEITDPQLAKDLLTTLGGFVFLLDCLELSQEKLRPVEQFAEDYRNDNFFVIVTDDKVGQLEGFTTMPESSDESEPATPPAEPAEPQSVEQSADDDRKDNTDDDASQLEGFTTMPVSGNEPEPATPPAEPAEPQSVEQSAEDNQKDNTDDDASQFEGSTAIPGSSDEPEPATPPAEPTEPPRSED